MLRDIAQADNHNLINKLLGTCSCACSQISAKGIEPWWSDIMFTDQLAFLKVLYCFQTI